MATYNLIKKIDGRNGEIIETFNNIEDARKELAFQLSRVAGDNRNYFPTAKSAEQEIAFAEEARESWGDDMVDAYIANLKEGLAEGTPFVAGRVKGECITLKWDCFSDDNVSFNIEEVEDL